MPAVAELDGQIAGFSKYLFGAKWGDQLLLKIYLAGKQTMMAGLMVPSNLHSLI